MRILIVSQYFWPESFRVNDLALGLKERGHDVVVLTAKPNYPKGVFYKGYSFFSPSTEIWNGIKVYRSSIIPRGKGGAFRLFINYFSFPFFASIKSLFIKEKFDLVFVYQLSPILIALPGIIYKKIYKVPLYHYIQDLWPESISAGGGIKNKYILYLMNAITKYIYRNSDKILVQSKAFIPFLLKQNTNPDQLIYYPNSAEKFYNLAPKEFKYTSILPAGFNIIFAGNIGEAQSFDTLIKSAVLLKERGISVNWVIIGDGRMKLQVEKKIQELELNDTFFMLGAYPVNEMPNFFSCADALLVSLKSDFIFTLTIPSKIQSYLACGKPIIGSLDGEGAEIIKEAMAGYTSAAEDAVGLTDSIQALVELNEFERIKLGQNARKYFENEFEREKLLDKLENIIKSDFII
jgi:glycosyltransferase involved in cell wall biosynthesis